MPFKLDAEGHAVLQDVGGNKLPVFVYPDGKESPFDADSTLSTISRLNGEAKSHRERAEALDATVKKFAGIEDPAAALKALGIVKNLDDKKLVDAGEVEKVKLEVGKAFQSQLDALSGEKEGLVKQLYDLTVGGAFATSSFIKDKFAIPADFVQARFGNNFGVENGKVYAVDANGQKIFSRARPGELADFDEALALLVENHPQKDTFLRGTGSSGSGAPAGGGKGGSGAGGKPVITRTQFAQLAPADQSRMAREATIVEG